MKSQNTAAKTAFAAANAAKAAAQTATAARNLLSRDPAAWAFADQAYWLCRAAQDAAQNACDELDPWEAEEHGWILTAFAAANAAVEDANAAAESLASLAEKAGHTITR